ncbi:MAG: radical SAM protein [Candidatus Omnitrophota bacterium]
MAVYIEAYNSGRLKEISDQATKMLASCELCPRRCKVNRLKGQMGYCRSGLEAKVFSFLAHHGEEPAISGIHGSGTIFFSGCNMACVYCQNFEFSQEGRGKEVSPEELAESMLSLQQMQCHNINLVTPTHVMPQILAALLIAAEKGLRIPIVYNTSGYERADSIGLLEGIVDIYLVDMRYNEDRMALKYSDAAGYPHYNRDSLKRMYSQVGVAEFDSQGIMQKGIIIRHLVLPAGIAGTEGIMRFIADEISQDTYISLMSQYTPSYRARNFEELNRTLYRREYTHAHTLMERCGLGNGWTQDSFGLARFAGENLKPSF